MSVVLAIHGNPGAPEDFAYLADRLAAGGTELVAPELSPGPDGLDGIIAQLDAIVRDRASEKLVLVGYSWGAYVALQYVRMGSREPAALILVNPYLVVTTPLPAVVAGVANVPVLGPALLSCAAPRLAHGFLEDTFFPASPPAPIPAAWAEQLASPATWHAAIRRKRGQQGAPLPSITALPDPTLVLIGADDRVARWSEQRRPLQGVEAQLEIRVIPGAGHSLPWTHVDAIASAIEALTLQEERP